MEEASAVSLAPAASASSPSPPLANLPRFPRMFLSFVPLVRVFRVSLVCFSRTFLSYVPLVHACPSCVPLVHFPRTCPSCITLVRVPRTCPSYSYVPLPRTCPSSVPSYVPLVCFRGFLMRIVPALSPLLAHLVHFTPSLVSAELTRRRRNASTCNLRPAASVLQPASLFSCRVRFPLSPYPYLVLILSTLILYFAVSL